MGKNLPSSPKTKNNNTEDIIEEFSKLIVEAICFADRSNLDWTTIISVSIFESSEYACFKSRGLLPLAAHTILSSIGASMVKRVNIDHILDGFDQDEIAVSIKSKLRSNTEKNNLILMLIMAFSEISSDLSGLNTSEQKRFH